MSDNGENGSSDQNNWLRKGWIWALKGWTKFLILALIILFVVLLYQSWSFVNKTTHQLTISPLLKNCNTPQDYLFTIAYPEKILIAEENAPARFIMVSVTQPRPFTTSITVTVQLHPQKEGVIFSDAKGNLLPAKLSLAPEQPGKLYISRQPLAAPAAIVPISVTCASILTPTKDIPLTAFDLNIESASGAFWRRFRELLLGPTTTLLAVVGSLIAMGFKLWEGEEARRRDEDRKRIDAAKKEKEIAEEKIKKEKEVAYKKYKRATEDEARKRKAKEEKTEQAKIKAVLWSPFLTLNTLRLAQSKYFENVGLTDLKLNPFCPAYTELDARTANYTTSPSMRSSLPSLLQAPALTIVWGNVGSGKTAAARWLGYNCNWPPGAPTISQTLPVYCPLVLPEQSNIDCFAHLTSAIAKTLIAFFSINKYTFILLPDDKKLAILQLLLHAFGSIDAVKFELEQIGSNLPAAELQKIDVSPDKIKQGILPLWADINATHEQAESFPKISLTDRYFRLSLLNAAKPLGFETIYLLTDIKLTTRNRQTLQATAEYLQALLDYVADLSSIGIYVKLFLPTHLQPYLRLPSHVPVETINWSNEELAELLDMRVQAAGLNSVRQLFNRLEVPSPEEIFIKVARGSPRRMLNFGNQLILRHITQSPEKLTISGALLKALADEFLKNDPARKRA